MSWHVCLAGATGWAGAELARSVAVQPDLALTAAVSRTWSGRTLGAALGIEGLQTPVVASVDEALAGPCDVFVEYTGSADAKDHVLSALRCGAHVVVGTSGLTDQDYEEIDKTARRVGRGVLACGNFALSAVMLLKCAELIARHLPDWEIVEYASNRKIDVPSGTVRELAMRLGSRPRNAAIPVQRMVGERQARGALLHGSPVHAVRLPGFSLGVDVIFGGDDETIVIRQNGGGSARPYVGGALIAIRRVPFLVGVHRGLDRVLDLAPA